LANLCGDQQVPTVCSLVPHFSPLLQPSPGLSSLGSFNISSAVVRWRDDLRTWRHGTNDLLVSAQTSFKCDS